MGVRQELQALALALKDMDHLQAPQVAYRQNQGPWMIHGVPCGRLGTSSALATMLIYDPRNMLILAI